MSGSDRRLRTLEETSGGAGIARPVVPERSRKLSDLLSRPTWEPRAFLLATVAVILATGVAYGVHSVIPVESLSLVFLVAVLATATKAGLWPSIYASVSSFLIYNFFLTEPYYTFHIAQRHMILTLLLFLAVAIVTGNLAARLRAEILAQRAAARLIANLYAFSRRIAGAVAIDDVVWAAVHHVASTLQCASLVLLPDESGRLAIIGGFPPEDRLDTQDWAAADRAWQNGTPSEWPPPAPPAWLFLPLRTAHGTAGLLGVKFISRHTLDPEQRRLLDALVDQVAIALERTQLAFDMEQARLLSETERLRGALLSSVSHDLRTPLVSIIGAASTLVESDDVLSDAGRRSMAETIRDEGERLNRYVQNLLDMTRLGYGALKLRLDMVDIAEVLGRAARPLRRTLADHRLVMMIDRDLPALRGDPILLEQVFANLFDNAAKYAPASTTITVTARAASAAVTITMTDEGPGVPAADREQVFDMFYRVRAGDGQPAGTGLGLAICKGIVEAHGGTIRLEGASPDGTGTRVLVNLPVATAGAMMEKEAS